MTEKRFKLIGDSNLEMLMQHQLKLPIYDYDNKKKRLSLTNTLNLLNSLYEENKQLKHKVNCLQDRLDDYVMVEKENEQLKKGDVE